MRRSRSLMLNLIDTESMSRRQGAFSKSCQDCGSDSHCYRRSHSAIKSAAANTWEDTRERESYIRLIVDMLKIVEGMKSFSLRSICKHLRCWRRRRSSLAAL
ncbi:hypothetical protein RchiOBHm_Chr3g0460771 [Rosa chinensis]|uniref:Uncharacterized protein n=1 Tax=Rosa chinensis TaxID=74649 RepID=A0A2P6R8G5_ROSCH|nr:hypothetical protein RchiOBHm_Chr3g0460771 [Rosa chinensis]